MSEQRCQNCRPEPHPRGEHHGDGGPCGHPGCPCFRFVEVYERPPLSTLQYCYICGRLDHRAGPACPYWTPTTQR